MKRMRKPNRWLVSTWRRVLVMAIGGALLTCDTSWLVAKEAANDTSARRPVIQIALLLDTSNSMDGLISQAKSQLWQMVNELMHAKQRGAVPELHVALYEYGNNDIPAETGYIRLVLSLTPDLDAISEKLFGLKTHGGNEYCGQVIQAAVRQLPWSSSPNDLKIIVIAGNEPFGQGPVAYQDSCRAAIAKGIVVNTIHCGDGVPQDWREGALLAEGRALNIDHHRAVVHIDAPQDQEIVKLSEELNKTYIAFGERGRQGSEQQMLQDRNAAQLSQGSATQRAICKANCFYQNSAWDLVDAVKEKRVDLAKIKPEELPESLRAMTGAQRAEFVASQQRARESLQSRINALNAQREAFVAAQRQKAEGEAGETLDQAVTRVLREQALAHHFEFAK